MRKPPYRTLIAVLSIAAIGGVALWVSRAILVSLTAPFLLLEDWDARA